MDGEGHQAGIERHPTMIMDGLRQHWQPTFTDHPVDINAVDDYLRTHLPEFDSPALEVPSPAVLRAALLRAKPTAPGPDRLPAAAWLADPRLVDILYDMMIGLYQGRGAPHGFNFADMVFIPK
eukprot:3913727-Pyramimonas_sp.AAC.1